MRECTVHCAWFRNQILLNKTYLALSHMKDEVSAFFP